MNATLKEPIRFPDGMVVHCAHTRIVDIAQLKPFPGNENDHPLEQIELLAHIMKDNGVRNPITVSIQSGFMSKGHGRLLAAQMNGWTKFPVDDQNYESPAHETADRVADNKIAELSEIDPLKLKDTILKMPEGFDLRLMGLTGLELKALEPESDADPDAVPEVPKEAKTKRGELWILGNHRLLIDDCTVKENVERLMGGEKAVLWSSDPPYGINHVDVSSEKGQSKGYGAIQNDDLQFDELKQFLESVIRNCIEVGLSDGFAFYMWHAMKMQSYAAAAAAAAAGILFHRQIIWVKPSLVFGRGQYHWRHELCLMGWLQGNECQFYGERNQTTVWNIGRENDKIHPTQKPIEISEIPISNHTKPGDGVIDPFLGSGSTLIACEKTGRKCYGTEIEPLYGDVILNRWATFTGKDPVREDGKKWSELKSS